jgi:CO/xanthine dehydrogenase FAD-binding subunit
MRAFVPDYDVVCTPDIMAALDLLASGEGWRPIAGGTDLMVLFNAGKLPYSRLFSIRAIAALRTIETLSAEMVLGAAVTYTQIRQDRLLHTEFPLLAAAASWTGGIANQNRGTLGGNIVNASPAADSAPALLVYDAEIVLLSRRGERRLPYRDFHTGYKQMQILPDELLYQIRLPRHSARDAQYSRKVGTRRAQAISKVSLAAAARLHHGTIEDIRIAAGSVAPVPLRCYQTENLLAGRRITPDLVAQAQHAIRAEIAPLSDIRSTEAYRSAVTANLLAEYLGSLQ